jgi:hypothetical protein
LWTAAFKPNLEMKNKGHLRSFAKYCKKLIADVSRKGDGFDGSAP